MTKITPLTYPRCLPEPMKLELESLRQKASDECTIPGHVSLKELDDAIIERLKPYFDRDAMEDSIAETLGSLGVTEVVLEARDTSGKDYVIPCKPKDKI